MKRFLILLAVIVLIYLIAGMWAWQELNYISGLYDIEATQYYAQGNWAYALKGDQQAKEGFHKHYKSGGYEHIVQAWKRMPPFLRPEVYNTAVEKIDEMINTMTIAEGEDIYHTYLGYDNAYLMEIMLRVGDLYSQQGNDDEAIAAYQAVKTQLKYSENAVEEADKRIAAIGN